ncbi:MAG: DNA-binding protein [Lachnotalea sp.]
MSDVTVCVPRMRTIRQVYEYLHEMDPGSVVGEDYLRKLVKQGRIRSYKAGVRNLINLDSVIEYFQNPEVEEVKQGDYGKIRKIY